MSYDMIIILQIDSLRSLPPIRLRHRFEKNIFKTPCNFRIYLL